MKSFEINERTYRAEDVRKWASGDFSGLSGGAYEKALQILSKKLLTAEKNSDTILELDPKNSSFTEDMDSRCMV